MIHPESAIVRSDDLRPAITDRPDRCGYCRGLLGDLHDADCVCRRRTVVVRALIEYVIEEPESSTVDHILFRRNEGTWCGSNALKELDDLVERMDCICPRISYEFVREATVADETEENFTMREAENDDVEWMDQTGKIVKWRAQRIDAQ